jgi:hypothetical protein
VAAAVDTLTLGQESEIPNSLEAVDCSTDGDTIIRVTIRNKNNHELPSLEVVNFKVNQAKLVERSPFVQAFFQSPHENMDPMHKAWLLQEDMGAL